MPRKTQIVVVGGGAAGLELVRRLGAKFGRSNHDIILIDRSRTHIWKPLLHEVAAGSLDANMDEVGYGGHAAKWGYRFFNGELEDIDRDSRHVITAPMLDDDGNEIIARHRIRYDYLVLAVGGISNDFGVEGVREHCLFLENREQADVFRKKLLNRCLSVSHQSETVGGDPRVRIAIVGGGATGVELAAELYNAAKGLRHYGLEVFDESRLDVTLLEAGPRLLPALPEKLAEAAEAELSALGVGVQTNTQVVTVDRAGITTKNGHRIEADLMLWAAGVKGPELLNGIGGLETNARNQVVVHPTLQSVTDERIFAIGDCCACPQADSDAPVPPRAQAAHQMAKCAFQNLVAITTGQPPKPFKYEIGRAHV